MLSAQIENHVLQHTLSKVVRGESCVIRTPSEINDDMWPTDHLVLLEKYIYPLASKLGKAAITTELENAIVSSASDPVGVHCAFQCFYMQVCNETHGIPPIGIDRNGTAKALNECLRQFEASLENIKTPRYANAGDTLKIIRSSINILVRDHGVVFN